LAASEASSITDSAKAKDAETRKKLEADEAAYAKDKGDLDARLQKNREENLKAQVAQEKAREKEREQRDKDRTTKQKEGDKGVADHKKELDKKAADKGINANASPEELAKQFLTREGSPLVPKSESTKAAESTPIVPKSESTKAAESTKKDIEQKGQEKAAAEKKAADEAEAKKKAEEESKSKQEQEKKTQESPSTLLAELNTKMATLLQYTFTVAHNTNENVTATRGLNKNGFKG
jgi:colicin import membrane protein